MGNIVSSLSAVISLLTLRKRLLKIIELGFSQKRKKLISNLSNLFPLQELKEVFQKIGLDENVRAEDLSLENWHILIDLIYIYLK
jgi:16S rRNA A1518/A1519 N6-dimethyltransferase RsmA/KsgA/DIM1 with predicted DNA glycosylase/AP lyase activity